MMILVACCGEIAEDCHERLEEISHESLFAQRALAVKSLHAFAAGHYEAAQALAVLVTETAVAREFPGMTYNQIKKEIEVDLGQVRLIELRVQAALCAISPFYTPWRPGLGTEASEELSRHVSVHQADVGHYTQGNAAIAILLVTSVLRALQQLHEQRDSVPRGKDLAGSARQPAGIPRGQGSR